MNSYLGYNFYQRKHFLPPDSDGGKNDYLWLSLMKWTSLLTSPFGAADRRASTFITKSLALRDKTWVRQSIMNVKPYSCQTELTDIKLLTQLHELIHNFKIMIKGHKIKHACSRFFSLDGQRKKSKQLTLTEAEEKHQYLFSYCNTDKHTAFVSAPSV